MLKNTLNADFQYIESEYAKGRVRLKWEFYKLEKSFRDGYTYNQIMREKGVAGEKGNSVFMCFFIDFFCVL